MTATAVRFVSWNLWGDARWPERVASVGRLLHEAAADVLAVQELSETSAAALDRMLASHCRAVPGLPGEPPLNIWFHAEKFHQIASGAAVVDDPGGERLALWTQLQVRDNDRSLLVATTHLSWDDYPDPALGASIRARQAERLAALIDSMSDVDQAVVLLGDFNDERCAFDCFDAVGLVECHQRLGCRAEPTQPVPEYEPFETLPRTVDRILINAAAVPLNVTVLRLPSTFPPPSDHWPVAATLLVGNA